MLSPAIGWAAEPSSGWMWVDEGSRGAEPSSSPARKRLPKSFSLPRVTRSSGGSRTKIRINTTLKCTQGSPDELIPPQVSLQNLQHTPRRGGSVVYKPFWCSCRSLCREEGGAVHACMRTYTYVSSPSCAQSCRYASCAPLTPSTPRNSLLGLVL